MVLSDSQSKTGLRTQYELLQKRQMSKRLTIGIPAENENEEKRVVLTPDDVKLLSSLGIKIYVQNNAGKNADFSDLAYSEAGAQIIQNKKSLFAVSETIIKMSPLSDEEIEHLTPNQIVFSALHLSTQSKEKIQKLKEKKITALAYEFFVDENNFNPFLHIIGEIIGSSSIMIASELMSNTHGGKGIMLGGLTGLAPTEIVILGTDISAQYAVRIALGLGASVKVFDSSLQNLISFHNLFGQHLYTSTIDKNVLNHALKNADVIINTMEREPFHDFVIPVENLSIMKKGAVIVDLKVDSGSVIESSEITTFEKPTFIKDNIIHYCVPNIASRVSRTSSVAMSRILTPFLVKIDHMGGLFPLIRHNISARNATYMLKGVLTNRIVAENFGLDVTDINLIVHVF